MRRFAAVFMVAAVFGGVAWLATAPWDSLAVSRVLHVPGDGTLQDVVNGAQPGNVIQVTAGNYGGPLLISGKSDLEINGHGSTILSGGALEVLVVENSQRITIRNFVLSDGVAYGALVRGTCDQVRIEDCRFTDDGTAGVGILSPATRTWIEKCDFHTLSRDGVRAYSGSSGVVVLKNEMEAIGGIAVSLGYEGGGSGVPDSTIAGNKIASVGNHGIVFAGAGTVVSDNRIEGIVNGNGIAVDNSTATSSATVSGNRISAVGGDGIVLRGNNHLAEKNRIERTGGRGMAITDGTSNTLVGNTVFEPTGPGFVVFGSLHELTGNKVKLVGRQRLRGQRQRPRPDEEQGPGHRGERLLRDRHRLLVRAELRLRHRRLAPLGPLGHGRELVHQEPPAEGEVRSVARVSPVLPAARSLCQNSGPGLLYVEVFAWRANFGASRRRRRPPPIRRRGGGGRVSRPMRGRARLPRQQDSARA